MKLTDFNQKTQDQIRQQLMTADQHNAPQVGVCKVVEKKHDTPMVLPKKSWTIPCAPVSAPRMTRRDKWLKPRRPCVQAYFDFRDKVQSVVGVVNDVPTHVGFEFWFPMPESWSKKKRLSMDGSYHRQRPDCDNLQKACLDSLFFEDGGVSDIVAMKRWCEKGQERVVINFF